MRRQDKLKVISEANQKLEESYLKGKSLLKEDILELKQMAKQMYSFLKNKGFTVKIATEKGEVRAKGISTRYDLSNEAQLIVQETTEVVWVIIPASSVVKVFMKESGENWSEEASKKYGDSSTWINNKEVINYVDNLGDELLGELKSKYPNMKHIFNKDQNISYIMQFGYGETRKGGRQE